MITRIIVSATLSYLSLLLAVFFFQREGVEAGIYVFTCFLATYTISKDLDNRKGDGYE